MCAPPALSICPAAHALADEVHSLFSLPEAALRACAVLDAPHSTAQDLIEVIELDANIAATVLRLANSALYGQRGKVDTLSRAVALIGQRALRDLVLATAAVSTFRGIPAEFVDMQTHWDNSTACGVAARLTAVWLRLREADALFLAGLLHGVGRLAFYARRPAGYRRVLQHRFADGTPIHQVETEEFGFDHAELGAALLHAWRLPPRLCAAVRFQHQPIPAATPHAHEIAVLHLAVHMAAYLAPGLKTKREPPPYQPDDQARRALAALNLTQAQAQEIHLEALAAGQEILEILQPATRIGF